MKFPNQDMPNSGDFPNPTDGVRKMSGMKQHEHHKIVAASLKMMGVKDLGISEHERLIAEARNRIKNVRDYAHIVYDNHIEGGIKFDDKVLAGEVFEKFVANFDHYKRDELLLFLATFFAEMTMKEIV